MSATMLLPSAPEAARLERLEAAFLRSPSPAWPPEPATGVTVEPPVHVSLESACEVDAWVSRYRTYGYCCKY